MELVITQAAKQYSKGHFGLRDFSLTLRPGVWGLLGPNGAGKSTLMRILATITKPTAGTITWNGGDIVKNPNPLRQCLGYLPQDFGVYPNLNAVEFLEYMAAVKGVPGREVGQRIANLLELVNLVEARKRPLGGYSGGMRQRIGIAQALLNDPQVLIVDEPTVGLDPEERVRFRNLLSDLAGERIVILSTHIVSDVEATASQIAMMDQGCLIKADLPEHFLKDVEGRVWEWVVPSDQVNEARRTFRISSMLRQSDGVRLRAVAPQAPVPAAVSVEASLEDAYLYHIQNGRTG
ncbi:MAG TPA: ABC transporter ATP-binding protein [Anaerolineaceae bacterium]|nr:ABC transporter ATP-binding protein [Anaerolineaceae bacterium]HPN53071.1 ABC transporter ATP-binding protein [Anaerolineaceae bacterium]